MAAGLGFKTFTTGEVLTAADTNGYLMQGVLVFASAAARDAAITSPQEGQCCYLKDTDAVLTYSGAAWVGFDDSNAIQNSIVDAKGDLISATADNTPARLAVGTNAQVLTADSTTATGLKWATPAASTPTFVGCKVTAAGNQSIANATAVYINFTTTAFETDATFHDTVTNNTRITIPTGKTGYYEIYGVAVFADAANGRQMWFLKNGAIPQLAKMIFPAPTGYDIGPYLSTVAYLTAGDYIEMGVYQVSGGAINVVGTTGVAAGSQFGVTYLGA